MVMRCPIPSAIREELSNDPFMRDCIIAHECEGRIEWHHAFTYAGKRRNELWSILPLCHKHHEKAGTPHVSTICKMNLRVRIDHFDDFVRTDFYRKYPKSNLFAPLTPLQ